MKCVKSACSCASISTRASDNCLTGESNKNSLSSFPSSWNGRFYTRDTLEWFLIECLKTKTKVISLASRNRHRQSNEPSEIEANTGSWRKARKIAYTQGTIGFGFGSDWLRK